METANDTAMHVTETKTLCSSLTCSPSKSEEITKDQEDELLCGNSEDGDEDDDSMRLRLSDDEVDAPNATLDVTTKKTSQDDPGMELESRVPDIAEQKSSLITQVLSNGTCGDASKGVDRDDRSSNDAFPEENDSRHCNGDAAPPEAESASGDSTTLKQTNKCKFAGHFGEYSSRLRRNSQSQNYESNKYAADPYNDKYYNKNTFYGGYKGSRSHNSYRRGSSSPSPSPAAIKQEPELISSQAIMTERVATESSNVDGTISNNVEPASKSDRTEEPETDEKPNEISKVNNDSSDTIHNSSQPAKVSLDVDSFQEKSKVHCDSGDETAKGEDDEVNLSNGSNASAATLVLGDLNDRDKYVIQDSETVSASAKVLDSDARKPEEAVEKIDEDVESAKTDERPISGDDSAMQFEVEKEAVREGMETEDSMSPMSGLRSSLERAELALAAEIENCDNYEKADEKAQEVKEILNSPEVALPVDETEKSHEESASDSAAAAAAAATEKHGEQSEQASTAASVAATNDGETVEAAVASVDTGASAKPMNLDIEAHIADLPDEKETSSEDESDVNNVRIHTSLKRTSREMLDDMELSKRMRIRRRKTESDGLAVNADGNVEAKASSAKAENAADETDDNASTVDNPVTNIIADSKSSSETSLISNTVVENSGSESSWKSSDVKPDVVDNVAGNKKLDECEVIEVPVKKRQKRGRKSMQGVRESLSQEDNQEKENVRQKRRTARNAEEIIRKELLVNSDSESNDSAGNLVAVNYNKTSNNLRAASPPTLKRNYAEEDEKVESKTIKKLKHAADGNGDVSMKTEAVKAETYKVQTYAHVRRFFRRDSNGKLAKLKQEELEELLIQKVLETITMRDEIGKLREEAKVAKRNQEASRERCQQLAKQIKDFEMVLNRYESERRANPDKTVVPIKINRSVGLQVNFVTEHGIQNMRQLGQIQKTAAPTVNGTSSSHQTDHPTSSAAPTVKRTIKVRSPRRSDPPVAPTVTAAQTATHSQPIISNVTPAALVVAKSVSDSRTQATPSAQQTTTVPHLIAPKQTILVNGPITSQSIRQATTIQVSKPSNSSDLIDLTQEEDKTKSTLVPQNAIVTTAITASSPSVSNVQKIAPRYHTVIQTLPANVALAAQSGIRVVQPSSQPTPTALVNNMNAPRLAYVMQSGVGSARQVVVTSAPAPIRPAPTIRSSYPLGGTITNGTVRVIPMTSTATIQVYKHPAALPEPPNSPANPSWKLPPPAPSLKISKVANGIVLSWNMALSDKYADIASYQLYAYQEVSGMAPSSSLWRKVGDVRALPLPMACTLTQFSEGNNYYFAVRAVDKHSRLGMYSQPGNISL